MDSKKTKKLYKAAKDSIEGLLDNDLIEGVNFFGKKALNKAIMDGVWKDYFVPKLQQILRLIVSRDPVCRRKF